MVTTIGIIVLCFLILYFILNIYISNKGKRIDLENIRSNTKIELTEKQVYISSYINTGKKTNSLKIYPLIIDTFSKDNQAAYIFSQIYLNNCYPESNKWTETEWRLIKLGTRRKVVKKLCLKDCYNYIYTFSYFGNAIYGLDNAAEFYYGKNYADLTIEEYIKLILLTENPIMYNLLDSNKKNKIETKVNKILQELQKKSG